MSKKKEIYKRRTNIKREHQKALKRLDFNLQYWKRFHHKRNVEATLQDIADCKYILSLIGKDMKN